MSADGAGPAADPIVHLDGTGLLSRDDVGGKAWSIAQIRRLGLPTPPAFVITTQVCRDYLAAGGILPDGLVPVLRTAVDRLEAETGRTFGRGPDPLLVSVRSGAAVSMPGMMDTVLNLGVCRAVLPALERIGPAFAAATAAGFRTQFEQVVGHAPSDDPWDQLVGAVAAVFESWRSPRALDYRLRRNLSDADGTAVTVQAMVFGNLDERSGTGVVFSRDPLSGSGGLYGEWLPRAQGEAVVAGHASAEGIDALAVALPEVARQLRDAAAVLEAVGRDVQDIEFTVEAGTLWLLQTRTAKRTPEATVRHAVALAREGVILPAEAIARVRDVDFGFLRAGRLSDARREQARVVARGKPASPGIAHGVVVTSAEACEQAETAAILARPTTSPVDVPAMSQSAAVITELGGSTSHAAVICRELGVPCVVGCGPGSLDGLAGQEVTVDGTAGVVYLGALAAAGNGMTDDEDIVLLTVWLAEQEASGNALREALCPYTPVPG